MPTPSEAIARFTSSLGASLGRIRAFRLKVDEPDNIANGFHSPKQGIALDRDERVMRPFCHFHDEIVDVFPFDSQNVQEVVGWSKW
jgi:hypothetical protein